MKKRTFRLTGLLYLLVIICAGFSQGYVRGTLVIPGDALATANNILNNRQPKEQGYYPDNFSIEINEAVARSLKINTPSPEFLKRKIKQ